MSREIIININDISKAKKFNEDALFQSEAFENVTEILKEHTVGEETEIISNCRYHDTIFIDGPRGAGKTAFMLNIENYYNRKIAKMSNKKRYTFFDSIDPTLLEHTEKFLSVVLARIVEKTNIELNNNNVDKNLLDYYYKSLDELSKSLSAIKTLPDDLGIDEIASNKSSLKLEQHSHEFFKSVSMLFNSEGLVILIDDVDMAFEKGFDVLEVVRKYLASPFIIPIVAGDINLYKTIIKSKFIEKIKDDNLKFELLDNLVEQYIRKVFPSNLHIQLKSIFEIFKENTLVFNFKSEDIEFGISYNDIKDFEIRHINLGINQVEFTYKLFSNNTRDLLQYISSKKNIYKEFFSKINKKKLDKKINNKYNCLEVSKKFDLDIETIVINKKIYKQSLKKTSDFYNSSYESKKKFLSKLTFNDYNSFISDRYSIYKAFTNSFFKEQNKLKLDNATDKYAIQSKSLKKFINELDDKYNDLINYTMGLFIYNNYYSSYQTRNYIYSGKFVENMIYSLDKDDNIYINDFKEEIPINIQKMITQELKRNNVFKDLDNFQSLLVEYYSTIYDYDLSNINDSQCKKIMYELKDLNNSFHNLDIIEKDLLLIVNNTPFGSDFSTDDSNYKNDFSFNERNELNLNIEYEVKNYSKYLVLWREIFLKNINLNSISLYEILLKFFKNLEKMKRINFINDKPIDLIRRIVLIFINSIAYFENMNKNISNTNYALSDKFILENILSQTPASLINIYPMLKKEFSLTRAFFFHPLVVHLLFPANEHNSSYNSKVLDLEWQKNRGEITFNIYNNIYNNYFTTSGKNYNEEFSKSYISYLSDILDLVIFTKPSVLVEVQEKFSKNKYEKLFTEILEFEKNNKEFTENDSKIINEYKNFIYGSA